MAVSPYVRKVILQVARSRGYHIRDLLADRAKFAARVRESAESGMVAVVTSGRDCDGVEWSGQTRLERAIPRLIEREIDRDLEYADGPMYHRILSPSAAREIRYQSRDRGMEAFENGHPHVIHSGL